jgi:hypothetical protein
VFRARGTWLGRFGPRSITGVRSRSNKEVEWKLVFWNEDVRWVVASVSGGSLRS